MKISKDSLVAKVNKIASENGIIQNVIYDRFFFDSFLCRLANSPFRNNFVLKGGLYLSSVLGIETRNTMDIDLYAKRMLLEKDNITKTFTEICKINVDDGVSFYVKGCERIREEDSYGGFQVKMRGRMQNLKYDFCIDVATGDPIIPSERNYNFICLVSGDILPIKVYSLESVVSEKLQTLLERKLTNSRSKDFYDLYILRKTQLEYIDRKLLKKAFENTFEYRHFYISKEEALLLIKNIAKNIQIQNRWQAFTNKAKYAYGLTFLEVMNEISKWVNDVC